MCVTTSRDLHISIRRRHLIMPNISRTSDTETFRLMLFQQCFVRLVFFCDCLSWCRIFVRPAALKTFWRCVCVLACVVQLMIDIYFWWAYCFGFRATCRLCQSQAWIPRCRHHAQWNNFTRSSIVTMHLKNNYKQVLPRVFLSWIIRPNLTTKRTMKKQLFCASNIGTASDAQDFPHGCQKQGGL